MKKLFGYPFIIVLLNVTKKTKVRTSRLAFVLQYNDIDTMAQETGIPKEIITESFDRIPTEDMDHTYKIPIAKLRVRFQDRTPANQCLFLLTEQKVIIPTELEFFAIRTIAKMMYSSEQFLTENVKGILFLRSVFKNAPVPIENLWGKIKEERALFKEQI